MNTSQQEPVVDANRDLIWQTARSADMDRYLAALFAPQSVRDDLMALIAFNAEIAQIADRVTEPGLGEIRLQWWRDALDALQAGEGTDNPIADALGPIVAAHGELVPLLKGLIDARSFDVTGGMMPDMPTLRAYLHKTAGTLYLLGVKLIAGREIEAEHAVADAALALGITGQLRAMPFNLPQGRCFVPRDLLVELHIDPDDIFRPENVPRMVEAIQIMTMEAESALGRAREAMRPASSGARKAFLTLALVEPYLTVLAIADQRSLVEIADISPLNRYGRLAWAAISGRI